MRSGAYVLVVDGRNDKMAGHFFDVDPAKAQRVDDIERQLAQEHRHKSHETGERESFSGPSDHDIHSERSSDSSSGEGDDELSGSGTSF